MTELEQSQLNKLGKLIQNKGVSNDFLVETIKLCGVFLNIKTPAQYSISHNISVQAAHRKPKSEIFGSRFIIDNE